MTHAALATRPISSLGNDVVSVEIISSVEALAGIASDWRDLERRSCERFGYFQSHAWCAAWARRYLGGAAPFARMHIVAIRRGGRLALLWPAMASDGPLGARIVQALGEPHTQYCTVLHDPALADDSVVAAFLSCLQSGSGGDVAILQMVPEGSLLSRTLARVAMPIGAPNETALLRLDAYPTWEAYQASLPAQQRKRRRDRHKRIARKGTPRFDVVWPHEPDYARLVALCVAWKRRWLGETGRISQGFAIADYDGFLASLPGDGVRRDGAVAFALSIGGETVAVELGFIHARHFYAYIGGFDWDKRSLSVGKALMELTIEWLHQAGIASYDLLGNPAEYKSSWSDTTVRLDGYLLASSLRGRLVGRAWFTGLRPALKRVYSAIPTPVRRALLSPAAGSGSPRQ